MGRKPGSRSIIYAGQADECVHHVLERVRHLDGSCRSVGSESSTALPTSAPTRRAARVCAIARFERVFCAGFFVNPTAPISLTTIAFIAVILSDANRGSNAHRDKS